MAYSKAYARSPDCLNASGISARNREGAYVGKALHNGFRRVLPSIAQLRAFLIHSKQIERWLSLFNAVELRRPYRSGAVKKYTF
jgi:hypothetical protein